MFRLCLYGNNQIYTLRNLDWVSLLANPRFISFTFSPLCSFLNAQSP